MSGHYLPLATIAWGLSLYYLFGNIDALGKYDGILGIRSLTLFGYDSARAARFFLLTWAVVLAAAVGAAAPARLARRPRDPRAQGRRA